MKIDHHAPCLRCGYDLASLPLEGVCPECALPVSRSVSGDLLRFADPRWSRRVHRGLRVVFRTVVWLLVATILMIVVLVFDEATATRGTGAAAGVPSAGAGVTIAISRALFLLAVIAGSVTYASGWRRASIAEPAPVDDHATKSALVRITGVLAPFAMAGWIAMAGAGTMQILPAIPVVSFALAAVVPIVTHLALSVGLVKRLTQRCGTISTDAHIDTLRRLRRTPVFVLLFAAGAVAILFHSLARSTSVVAARPGSVGTAVGAAWVVMGAVWMIVAGEFETLSRRMKNELALRPQNDPPAHGPREGPQ